MALTYSQSILLGASAKPFELISVDGKKYGLDDFSNVKALVILFICNHCPYVQAIEDRILQLHQFFEGQSVQFLGICSNDPTDYPDDSPERLLKRWREKSYGFPYLIDSSQNTAREYGAVCTPDMYAFDESRKLVYHGRLDDNWKEPLKVKQEDLKMAVQLILTRSAPLKIQYPSMGCSIKWKKSS